MKKSIKRDGKVVISSRANYTPEQKAFLSGEKLYKTVSGRVHLTPTDEYKFQKLSLKLANLESDQSIEKVEVPISKKEKKHKKKKNIKKKKHAKKTYKLVRDNLSERTEKNGNLMAELLIDVDSIIKYDNILWIYNKDKGCYNVLNADNTASKLRMLLGEKERLKVSTSEYNEAYKQLMISTELVSEEKFFSNKPFVNCINGVVDVVNGKLLPHSPSYRFKHYIKACYNPDAGCKRFMRYVDDITNGDSELTELLQVVMGYMISHYNNAKTAFLLFGASNTGKSVICEVLKNIIGADYVSHADLSSLHHPEFAAELSGKILNIAPDLSNEPLKDVGFFKSLVSHNDTIAARRLYSNPDNVKGGTKMLFATNHLLNFDRSLDIGDIEAVFNRFIFFPFQNRPITAKTDDKNLAEKMVSEEIDGIFTWAMTGLKKYVNNGERFPHAKLSYKLKQQNIAQFCPEKSFFDKCIVIDDNAVESTSVVKAAYEAYCRSNGITLRGNIDGYIKNHKHITSKKKRVDDNGNTLNKGNPRAAYIGIRLKDKFRKK